MNINGDRLKFSTKEKRAAVVFFVIVLSLVIIPELLGRFQTPLTYSYSIEEDSTRKRIQRNYNVYEQKRESQKHKSWNQFPSTNKRVKIVEAPFNPDTVSQSGWVALGLSERQAEVLLTYKERIGGFYDVDALYKAFVLDSNKVNQWKPFLVFEKKKVKRIELNSASIDELVKLKGIGQGYAKRIITYRDKLGGYHSVTQVREIYNFPEELAVSIEPFIRADTLFVNKIRINFVSLEELVKHPYFDYKTARALLNYRQEHGPFRSISEVLRCKAVEGDMGVKWLPYLNFEE